MFLLLRTNAQYDVIVLLICELPNISKDKIRMSLEITDPSFDLSSDKSISFVNDISFPTRVPR